MSGLKNAFGEKTQSAYMTRPAEEFMVPLVHRETGQLRQVLQFKSLRHFSDTIQYSYTGYSSDGCFLDLSNKDLRGIDLSETTDLKGAKFDGSILTGTAFQFSNLAGASFVGCDLRGVNFRECNLTGCNLMNADLEDAKMDSADIADTILHYAKVSREQLALCKNAPDRRPLTAYDLALRTGRISRVPKTA